MNIHGASYFCPLCEGPWTNLVTVCGVVFRYHDCEVAECYIGWTWEHVPIIIPDVYIYTNPPERGAD